MNRHLLASLGAALLAACAAKDARPAAAAGKADPPFVFPHSPHLEGEVDCKSCHGDITVATRLLPEFRHAVLPARNSDACNGCHDDADFKEKVKLALPARTREFTVRMDHAAHLARPGVTCQTCHKSAPEAGASDPVKLDMGTCTACHKHQADYAAGRCMPCHLDLKRYPKPVAAFQHAGDFLKLHGALAKPTAERCAACHDQTFCADCHSATTVAARPSVIFPEEVQRALIHRGDFVSRHMVEAGADPASCRRCHGSRFCDSCHTGQNLTGRGTLSAARNPHPAGWGRKDSGDFHGFAARKNIVACAGCHDNGADAVCVSCHRTAARGGIAGVSPHPKSWKKTAGDVGKNPMCGICH
jgi:hypothetical protein